MSGGYSLGGNMSSGRKGKAISISPAKQMKRKKMVSIKQRIRNWLNSDDYNEVSVCVEDSDVEIRDQENSMNFNVVSASGGRIVQVRYYDRKSDRTVTKLHIITPDENLAESLAHILAIETMSR